MGKIFAGELRIFWRSIYMPGVFAAVLGYLNWLCYPSLERAMKAADPYQFLYHYRNMQGFTVLLFACMLFLSFELFYKVPADDVWEYAGSYGATGRIATAKRSSA